MEENQKSSFKIALNYALITGAILIVLDLIFYVMDLPTTSEIRYVTWLVVVGCVVWGQKVFRDIHSNGFMSYGKSFSVGFTISFLAGILLAVYTFVFVKFFDPSIITQALETAEQKMMQSGDMTDEQLEMGLEMAAKFTTPFMMSVWVILAYTIGGAIISLVTSIFMKKEAN